MNQRQAVLHWLKRRPLTALEALEHIGTMRLAAHIEVLRKEGHIILTKDIKNNGKTYAQYHLIKERR
jgi:hypothetical protein